MFCVFPGNIEKKQTSEHHEKKKNPITEKSELSDMFIIRSDRDCPNTIFCRKCRQKYSIEGRKEGEFCVNTSTTIVVSRDQRYQLTECEPVCEFVMVYSNEVTHSLL